MEKVAIFQELHFILVETYLIGNSLHSFNHHVARQMMQVIAIKPTTLLAGNYVS